MWSSDYLYFLLQLSLQSYQYYGSSQAHIGAKLLSTGDWEKANKDVLPAGTHLDCLPKSKSRNYCIRNVIPLLENLHLNSILQKATRSRSLKLHSVEWWGQSGQSHHIRYFFCSSLMLFTVVQFESGTALLRDKAHEGYHSLNRALLTVSIPLCHPPNLLPIWEHPQWVSKRDRGSHQPKIKPQKIQYHWLLVH